MVRTDKDIASRTANVSDRGPRGRQRRAEGSGGFTHEEALPLRFQTIKWAGLCRATPLTLEGSSEAEHIIAVQAAVALAIAANTRRQAEASARLPRQRYRVLDRGVLQPAGVAPVQTLLPGTEELLKGSHHGILLLAGLLGLVEVELVAPFTGLVGKNHA